MLDVRLTGGLALTLDGVPLAPPRSRRGRALLAWLALNPGRHARGQLAGRFWPDVLDASARTSLRAALTELRGALGEGADCLVATREAVALDGPRLQVDVRVFAEHLAAGDPAAAVAACSGELLPEMDDDWVHAARADHAARCGEALATLATAAEARGDLAAAVRLTREAAALDPLGEEAHRALIRRQAAAGDRAGALTTGEQLAERLRTALGIAPSAATRALMAEVRGTDTGPVAPAAAHVPPPPAVARVDDVPFVGRGTELAGLGTLLAAVAQGGTRRLALVTGEPGVGKTRLAMRFAGQARRTGATVVLGRCSQEPLAAYEPFAEILHGCEVALGAARLGALAGPAAGELGRLRGLTAEATDADPGTRHRLFDAVDAVLSALTPSPLLVLIDDLQWADRATVLLLLALLRSPRATPMLVVATYRSSELGAAGPMSAALADLRRDGVAERIPLGGLAVGDVAALAAAWLGEDVARDSAAAVHARSGGNAFFAQELLRSRADAVAGDPVPESVREAIAVRRARLPAEADDLLATAAVLGQRVELPALLAASGLEAREAEAALDALLGAQLLRVADDRPDLAEFPHALVRDAVYAELNAWGRSRRHARAAEALLARGTDEHLEEVAFHLAAGPDPVLSVPYLERAADRAMAMAAYEQAARFRADAVAVLDRAHADDGRRGALLAAAGEALLHAGDRDGAVVRFEQAAALARAAGDSALLARAALGRCGLGVQIAEIDDERVAALEEALAGVADHDPALASALLAHLAVELYYAPSRDRSEHLSVEAVRTARSTGDPRTIARALNARHVALWRPDRLAERLEAADEMIDAACTAGDPVLELQGRNWRVVDLLEAGQIEPWHAEMARHGALAQELRLPSFAWYTPLWAAMQATHGGRHEEGARLREQARAAGTQAGDDNAELFAEMLGFIEMILQDRLGEMDLAWVQERIETAAAGFSYRASYAWLLADRGRTAEAREQLAIVVAGDLAGLPFDTNWPSALAELGEAAMLLGDRDAAEVLRRHLTPYAGRQLTAGRGVVTYGAADRQLGHAAAILGLHDEAAAHYAAAIRIDEDAGFAPWADRARAGLDRLPG